VWALDFLSDQTADPRPIKFVMSPHKHTRAALTTRRPAVSPPTTRRGARTSQFERRGSTPAFIRCENGPEFTAEALKECCLMSVCDALASSCAKPLSSRYRDDDAAFCFSLADNPRGDLLRLPR
jgi:hypothetical protein